MFPETNTRNPNPKRGSLQSTLADQHCRFVIAYFRKASEDHASVDEIADALARHDDVDETRIATRLHHAVLPKLDDVGVADYDARTNTVRYHGHSHIEQSEDNLSEFDSDYCGGVSNT